MTSPLGWPTSDDTTSEDASGAPSETGPGVAAPAVIPGLRVGLDGVESGSGMSPAAPGSGSTPLDLEAIEAREDEHYIERVDRPALVAEVRSLRARCESLQRENTRLAAAQRAATEAARRAVAALEHP